MGRLGKPEPRESVLRAAPYFQVRMVRRDLFGGMLVHRNKVRPIISIGLRCEPTLGETYPAAIVAGAPGATTSTHLTGGPSSASAL